ncbi:hypothetical protein PAPYR_7367 [Paratrimastix pyriformis]|uniref:Uncharacterized protein n=1 Tax=Paratrimastix pyriformis TaxID=342808 RepID=A0ABQ8UH48_9EUKA|nr:hypothetical protein PAPYR_7367 [Paratrimastix pyriformis]
MFTQLPPELLGSMINHQDTTTSLRLYILLLGLSHAIRQAVRGTLRQFLLDDSEWLSPDDTPDPELDSLPTPTADALAALVGPCKGLVKLTLPSRDTCLWGCRAQGDNAWVDEAFAGHTQLAVLRLPLATSVMPAIERILGHLPGLEDFHLTNREVFDPAALAATLVRCCPRLEALHLGVETHWALFDPTPLRPLCGRLKRLSLSDVPTSPRFEAFLESLTCVEQLSLYQCTPGLAQAAPRLTHLWLLMDSLDGLPKMGLHRLESLEVHSSTRYTGPVLAQVLAANRATIRSLSLWPREVPRSLFQLLGTCPHLAHLNLHLRDAEGDVDLADLPPELLHRLVSLRLSLGREDPYPRPISIASATLRTLDLQQLSLISPLTLDCPALESLTLPEAVNPSAPYPLVMRCPELRQITGLGEHGLAECQHMSRLTRVDYSLGHMTSAQQLPSRDALDALLAGSPALSRLSGLRFAHPRGLAELCQAAPCLSDLWATLMHVVVPAPVPGRSHQSPRLTLSLPGHVRMLNMTLSLAAETEGDPVDLCVEAPGLCSLTLYELGPESLFQAAVRSLTILRCPALANLHIGWMSGLTEFTLAGSLRSLHLDRCHVLQPASLLACLGGQHGACLGQVTLAGTPAPCRPAWPQLAAALGALPRLVTLELGDHPTADLALSCPALRCLRLPRHSETTNLGPDSDATAPHTTRLRSLVLDCPLLEELRAPVGPHLARLEVAGSGTALRRVEYTTQAWAKRLEGRWPWARIVAVPWDF